MSHKPSSRVDPLLTGCEVSEVSEVKWSEVSEWVKWVSEVSEVKWSEVKWVSEWVNPKGSFNFDET